ncbi:hypothetical protein GETHLI_14740 [Geothrix limicola]|uniref:DUF4154 domain-containing protein n=1 Tax=Geothrix limicola TaxID=2927978 RepID=A0ABQ5QE82_9BACT|nr:YfiR family protein [Geothrix limicola]GLH72972.1 hypothetical protein GETHLI_14740 [Geothrix limicola]
MPCLCAVLVLSAGTGAPALEKPTEYSSKAKILLMILPYIQWPSEANWKEEPFKLAVLGESPFGTRLDEGTQSLTVHHRPIQIRYISKVRDAEGCQALFICASEQRRIDGILSWTEGKEILTLSDDESLARKGVILNLLLEGGYVRLVVNPEAARRSNLLLGSRLMSLAKPISAPRPTP